MNREHNINETLDQALRRLGNPPDAAMEMARDRVRQELKTANPAADSSAAPLDASAASLWRLRQPFIVTGLAIALIVSAVTFAALREQPESLSANAAAWPIPDGTGKQIVLRVCADCHTLEGIEDHVYDSRDQYRSLILSMVSMHGASFTEEEITVVTEYLWEIYGRK